MGMRGAAVATCLSGFYNLIFLGSYVAAAGLRWRVCGDRPLGGALQGWREYGKLAYPACVMKVAER